MLWRSYSFPTIRIVEFNRFPAKGSSTIFVVWKIFEKIENMPELMLELRRFSFYKFKWAFNHKDKWPMDVRTFHEIRWCLGVHASNRRAMVCTASRSLDCKGQCMGPGPYRPNVALVLAVLLIAKEREGTKSRLTIRKRPRSRKLPTRPTKSVLPGIPFFICHFWSM